ncbi:STAS domain-containing protein [Alkalicoccus daliensis]|uniref:RsbT co-antagonist protein RsbR n=1 Tax=Alkalicoccus daliensis TaxID=745820 RepID=A0A1H0AHA7_9BACI|nr:STAS domain-containing protein [Alkalicoccus daliensis]SDN32156.1 rsbT co-antagonist protein RsbR [Alkalicoccus daliensis]
MELQLPLPLYKFNKEYEISFQSKEAELLFSVQQSVLDILDVESIAKFKGLIDHAGTVKGAEINLLSVNGSVLLCTMYADWEDGICECAFIPLSSSYHRVSDKLTGLQNRLSETNFELFEKSEELSEILKRYYKLSGPFIELTESLAIVPIFGDLSREKLQAIQANVFERAFRAQPDRVLLDFTSVGFIEKQDVGHLRDFIVTFKQMGMETVLIGMHPAHARILAPFKNELEINVDHSAKTAIKFWMEKENLRESR